MLELMDYNISSKPSRHGDILYDDLGNPMAVITGSYHSNGSEPWNIRGRRVWLAVGVASIRGVSQSWNLSSDDKNLVDISTIGNPSISWKLASSNTGADGSGGSYVSSQSTETNMDATFNYSQPVKDSRELTSAILDYNSDYMAAKYCRSKLISGLGQMDLPSIDALMRIYQARNMIDLLDPTAESNPTKKLSNWGFGSSSGSFVWTSSESSNASLHALRVPSNGRLNGASTKNAQFGCVPVLEIAA